MFLCECFFSSLVTRDTPLKRSNLELYSAVSLVTKLIIILSIGAFILCSLSFTMNINPGMAAPFVSKNLGNLSNPAVKELLMAVLKAVENVGAHKATG
jgi:hypothetical protein